ncbi:hypothetical protein ACLKA7_005711 [Drosophila subpalustris]
MWMYKGSLALIAAKNQRISKTDERQQRVQSTESLSAASDISDYLANDTRQLFYKQNREIWRRLGEKCRTDEAGQKETKYNKSSSIKFECLLTLNELEILSIENPCDQSECECECECSLCLNRRNAIASSASKAKYFIDQAVHNYCPADKDIDKDKDNVSYSCQGKYQKCLINLAHLILVLACLRGIV